MPRKLVAALACRNQGSRLYGKPVQNLDVKKGVRIIDYIIDSLKSIDAIDDIVLGISEGVENEIFVHIAQDKGLKYVVGNENDVLSRLIACGQSVNATDIFRVTSESPFLYYDVVGELWDRHQLECADATFMDEIIDGCGFEIITQKSLERSHSEGENKHRSELCSLYIRENSDSFRILTVTPPEEFVRHDLRLTVDNPEDLAVCRIIYREFIHLAPQIPLEDIVKFLDDHPELIAMVLPYTEVGYSTMYL